MPNSEPTLSDAVVSCIDSVLSNLFVCAPAKIETYDYEKCEASVKPLLKRKTVDNTEYEYPVITGVPVIWPRTRKSIIHLPLEKGDGVLLLFADRAIDTWLDKSFGSLVAPSDRRKHALTDAIAIPGLYPFTVSSPATGGNVFYVKYNGATIVIDRSGTVNVNDGNLTVDK